MTLDEMLALSLAPEKMRCLIAGYREAQGEGALNVASQDRLPMRKMAPMLANVTLMERLDDDHIVYRIAGENIVARLGFNPTGKNFLDFFDAAIREKSARVNNAGLTNRCGHYAVYENQYESGRRMISESLMLPMRKNAASGIDFIFGYHIHHQATDVYALGARTSLMVDWSVAEFVDIGFGVPNLSDAPATKVEERAPALRQNV